MFSDQEYSERDEGPSKMEMLTQQMQQLQAAIDSMQRAPATPAPGVKPHLRGAFMAESSNYGPRLTQLRVGSLSMTCTLVMVAA